MEKTFKNSEILRIIDSLRELSNVKLPFKASWNVSKNIKKFESSLNDYFEFENKLVKKYALLDKDGKIKLDENSQPKFAPNNRDKFIVEKNDLLECEDKIDLLTIDISELENVNITPSTLVNLEFMFTTDDNETK